MERLENEILEDTTPNATLAPILSCLNKPISLKEFRAHMQHLPTMHTHKRDDHIYGAARYLANSLGIPLLVDTDTAESIDPPLPPPRKNELWRQAKFHCRCHPDTRRPHNIGTRAFCEVCSFIILYDNPKQSSTKCPNCNTNDFWEHPTVPCIACQLATIVFRNPFKKRLNEQLEYWLTSDDTSADSTIYPSPRDPSASDPLKNQSSTTQAQDLLRLRNLSIERSFQEIRRRGSAKQTTIVFENLSVLQNDIQYNYSNSKSALSSHIASSIPSEPPDAIPSSRKRNNSSCNMSAPRKKTNNNNNNTTQRSPLLTIDINSMTTNTTNTTLCTKLGNHSTQIGNKRRNKQARTLRIKENKKQCGEQNIPAR